MYTTLKFFHLAFFGVWFAGLLALPWIFGEHVLEKSRIGVTELRRLERTVYFAVTTPAAVLAVVFGSALMFYGFSGAWLPIKLTLLVGAVMFHLYCGHVMQLLLYGRKPHSQIFFRALSQIPLVILVLVAFLATVKPI